MYNCETFNFTRNDYASNSKWILRLFILGHHVAWDRGRYHPRLQLHRQHQNQEEQGQILPHSAYISYFVSCTVSKDPTIMNQELELKCHQCN